MKDVKLGFAVGFFLVLLFYVIILTAFKKTKVKGDYDERQQIVRGKGYKAGFFTLLICNVLIAVLTQDDGTLPYVNADVAVLISAFVAIIVFAVYCIFKDGYFGVVENPKSTLIIFLLIAILNVVIGITNCNKWVVDGKLSMGIMNFACGITMLVVSLAGVIKLLLNKREDE